jgi:hypothetical protein
VVKRYGFGQNEDQMVYMINLTTGGNVVVWAADVALVVAEEPGACTASLPAQISGAWWCMVVYGGVSLC